MENDTLIEECRISKVARNGVNGVRTSIPFSVVKAMGLRRGDCIEWTEIKDQAGRKAFKITKYMAPVSETREEIPPW